jgi:hypothetical protein
MRIPTLEPVFSAVFCSATAVSVSCIIILV